VNGKVSDMARRADKYVDEIAGKLKDPKYADAYIKAAVFNHDEPFKVALAGMIDKFGHVELADRIGMTPNNLSRLVKRLLNEEPVQHETLERLVGGFGLSLRIDTAIAVESNIA